MSALSVWRASICLCGFIGAALCYSWGLPSQLLNNIRKVDAERRLVAVTHGLTQPRAKEFLFADLDQIQNRTQSLEDTWSTCPPLKLAPTATSVRNLRPVDVRVIFAIGDSITAAFAARGWLPLEFRGLSFPIGGDAGRVTLPNILAKYSVSGKPPVGAASGFTDPLVDASAIFGPKPMGPVNPAHAHLNAAISNGVASSGPNQTAWLTKVMAQYEDQGKMSLQNDWKLLVFTLGANDLRAKCRGSSSVPEVVSKWKATMNNTLSLVKQHFPRTFVALLAVPNVGDMGKWGHSTEVCSLVQDHLEGGHCPQGGETKALQVAMNLALEELQDYWSDTVRSDDFAVVYQPFTGNMSVPDISYLSALDCFHPGQKGHAEAAVALWNSLVTPRSQKKTSFSVGAAPICADKDTILHVD